MGQETRSLLIGERRIREQLADEIATVLEAQDDYDSCLRFPGYNHNDGCGHAGLECAAAIIRARWGAKS